MKQKQKVSYPTDFDNYDDLLDATYGDFDNISVDKPLFNKTIISKRFCSLFPKTASIEIQKISVATGDNLLEGLGQEFSNTILPFGLHQKLYNIKTPDEVKTITDTIKLALDKGEWNQHPNPPQYKDTTIHNDKFDELYHKIMMPFINTPIPSLLIEKVELELDKMGEEMQVYINSQSQVHPADLFAIKLREIAKEYFTGLLNSILLTYPKFTNGSGASSSVWSPIKTIKWCHKIQNHIQSIPEINYIIEPFLLKILSQKAITIEDFLNLNLSDALELQGQAEEAYKINSHEEAKPTQKNITTMKLIPWRREINSLKNLWEVLVKHGYIGSEVTYSLLSSHFAFIGNQSKTQEGYSMKKIVWKNSLTNLLLLIRDLNDNGIINANPFKGREDSSVNAAIHNLIEEHFCRPDLKNYRIDTIRKSSKRISGKTHLDSRFLADMHKHVQIIK